MSQGWAQGMFAKPKRRDRGARAGTGAGAGAESAAADLGGQGGGGDKANARRRQNTLTELRWHQELPADGPGAHACAQAVSKAELTAKPSRLPTFSKEQLQQGRDQANLANDVVRGSNGAYVEVSTGLRLRYYTLGNNERIILLLHGLGESAGVMAGLANRLASHSYQVISIDLRGHGQSDRSSDNQYNPRMMAADLEGFVTELDLYVRPLAMVGVGVGAYVALEFAHQYPQLVGALVLAELSVQPPADAFLYHPGQGAGFANMEHAASFLCSRAWGHNPRVPEVVLKYMDQRGYQKDDCPWVFHIDPHWFFKFSSEGTLAALQKVQCPVLLAHGDRSHLVSKKDAQEAATACVAAPFAHVFTIPKAGHYLLEDAPLEFRNAILGFLLKHDDALMVKNKQTRRPELLGIRPLPQYATVEEAIKALAPRKIPTQEDIEEALAAARLDDEEPSDDEDEHLHRRTGLIKDDPEYFGFIG